MSEVEVKRVTEDHHHHGRRQYGTFSSVPAYTQPATGLLQPESPPPPGSTTSPPPQPSYYYHYGYEAVPGYVAVVEGRPLRQPHLPCCGIGIGWFLFIIGFFLAATPWFVGVFVLLCVRLDYREKPGLIACTIAQSWFRCMHWKIKGEDIMGLESLDAYGVLGITFETTEALLE